MANAISISFLGDKALERKLNRIPVQTRNKIVQKTFRQSNKRIRDAVGRALSGEIVSQDTGRWFTAMRRARIRTQRAGGWFRQGFQMPEREDLGLGADAKADFYYPQAIEYGAPGRQFASGAPNPLREFAPIRTVANRMQGRELARIADEIGQGIILLGGKA